MVGNSNIGKGVKTRGLVQFQGQGQGQLVNNSEIKIVTLQLLNII